MKVLIALTYYRPHISGLTIYVERLARALAARGHGVTVLTSQYDRQLPEREEQAGVTVVRVPVAARLSKGVIMPAIGLVAWRLVPQHDVFSIHLPQFDATGFALRGRLLGKPVVVTYHSDLLLPPSLLNWAAGTAIDVNNDLVARLADTLVAYTDDFARHSRLLSRYLDKVQVIPPPVELPEPAPEGVAAFRARHNLAGRGPVIGLAVRLAAEKGVEYLLQAMPALLECHPGAVILHAGPREAIGEADYLRRIEPLVAQLQDRYIYVGALEPPRMAEFFASCDVHVLPSINNTETFGLVQVEAALCGTPSVASALPGVRMPTQMTGMGLTVPPRDPRALAEAILAILADRPRFVRPRAAIAAQFSPAATAERYEALFEKRLRRRSAA
ncbi:MAG: glycosyltransferase family 4 protein [Anaerolineales bacterium]|nr:glycosyltransferase family 4 protein [Anaerolineales bacterium]